MIKTPLLSRLKNLLEFNPENTLKIYKYIIYAYIYIYIYGIFM